MSAPQIIITMGSAHISRVDRASARRFRKMTETAVGEACGKAREQNARPITAVDDLTAHSLGPWVAVFARCLARSAKRAGISIVGGEMSQMRDTYAQHYAGVWVTVVSLETRP